MWLMIDGSLINMDNMTCIRRDGDTTRIFFANGETYAETEMPVKEIYRMITEKEVIRNGRKKI